MIDLKQISLRLKNSAYALEQTAALINMHHSDACRLHREALNNQAVAEMIDSIIESGGSLQ